MRHVPVLLLLAALCLAQSGGHDGIDRSNLDSSCKPCDDFWRYANGGWVDKNPIPAAFPVWGTFTVLAEGNRERLKSIVEKPKAKGTSAEQQKVSDFYASCVNTAAIDGAGAKPLQPWLDKIGAIKDRRELVAMLVSLEPQGGITPTHIDSTADLDHADRVITAVAAGGLSLPDRDYYFRDDESSKKIRDEFLKFGTRLLTLLGDPADNAASEAKTVLDFETALAKSRLTNVELRDPRNRFHKMDLAKLEQIAPAYDWKGALKLLNVSESVAINVVQPEFVKAVNAQLEQAPVETWKTWLRWRIVNEYADDLSKPFYDEWFHFRRNVLNGATQPLPRWNVCVSTTDRMLGEDLGRLYVEKHFPPEAQRRIKELVENLRATLKDQLEHADWLEPQTRANAIKKLQSFDPHIGFPEKWHDYSRIRVNRNDYFASLESAVVENRRVDLARIGKPVDRTEWSMTTPTVNAYYTSTRNSITFPAGILQPPFFDKDADDALNYGAIGAVIGHEMGHGFDDQGSKFDASGNLSNWWTDQDRAKFEVRAGCVTSQFDSIDAGNGLRHKGKLVTGEAMGDLGGLTLAYKAYHRALNGKEPPVIDGFTGDQRFFLAFARVWANNQTVESARLRLNTDPHPLPKFRTNATLQNMPEFQRAFSCKLGDSMVRPPDQQCHLW